MNNSAKTSDLYSKYLPLITALLFIFLLLTNSVNSISLVNTGLTTWSKHMIPSLFPFMVLSGILIRTGISRQLSNMFYPLLGKLFRLSPDCIYVIIMGFLCGFPMGASIIADSLSLKKITQREANLLLAFCNNIGPIYFISFVSAACPYYPLWITLSIMYVVPLLYGLILRYTNYRDIPYYYPSIYNTKKYPIQTTTAKNYSKFPSSITDNTGYMYSIEESIAKALTSIMTLGAYMVIFNVLQLPFYNTFYQLPTKTLCIIKGLIEINSGINSIKVHPELYSIVYSIFLPFGGLCCIFQTYAMLKDTPLSLSSYLIHKILQTLCTILLYVIVISI